MSAPFNESDVNLNDSSWYFFLFWFIACKQEKFDQGFLLYQQNLNESKSIEIVHLQLKSQREVVEKIIHAHIIYLSIFILKKTSLNLCREFR